MFFTHTRKLQQDIKYLWQSWEHENQMEPLDEGKHCQVLSRISLNRQLGRKEELSKGKAHTARGV